MKTALTSCLNWLLGIESSINTQSAAIKGNGNIINQTINNYVLDGSSPPTIKRHLKSETLKQASRTVEKPLIVFLGGPYIEPDKEDESRGSAASILRFQLFHRLKGEKFEVSLGEYPKLKDSYKSGSGKYHNAADAELDHARSVASLVVMIPDSPGSFAEIGAFSLKREICTKMIVLTDITHEKSMGYLNTGPVACAKALGSTVKNVDYTDVEGCFEIVKAFSNSVKTQIQLRARLEG